MAGLYIYGPSLPFPGIAVATTVCLPLRVKADMDVEAEQAASGKTTMPSVSSRLSALCTKIRNLAARGTDTTVRRVGVDCICIAMYNLGDAAARPAGTTTRMRSPRILSTVQFEEECVLGACHNGDVVKVRHRVTGKTFALKTVSLQFEEEEAVLALRVLREACFMAACRGHPSLVGFHGVGRHPSTGRYCLIMEHVGPSLSDVLDSQRRSKPFPEHDVRRIIRQVLSAAKAMHDRGIVHRAINPANVFVGDSGNVVKIGNYGEATSVSETDVAYRTTMAYMAPEALLPALCGDTELVDSWSIGCMMAELLTGEPLFALWDGDDDDDVAGQLYKIFDVLGVPGKRTMRAIKMTRDPDARGIAEEVKQWRARQRRVGKSRNSNRLGEVVHDDVLSDDGFEVLTGLLTCNPKKRLTAAAALQLPWFTDNDDSPAPAVSQVGGPYVVAAVITLAVGVPVTMSA
ncbi:putative cyclin-dependent kinase F-2 [Phragmites australis]|uniref:putative cyclin-dependent kinase F-2 n=1 Tax=Phragmites australis TaxID=29695 RepID=UPI002D79D899|nr:putative cyclin-dependent kinase F-2 [Phragmites australis]